MAENTIIRSRYRYRPDNSDKYVTVHFETSSDIVKTPGLEDLGITEGSNITDVIKYLINDLISTRALVPICNTHSWFVLNNPVLANGQIGYETDTCKMKMGNGINPYSYIKYASGGSSSSGSDDDGINMEVIANTKEELNKTNPIIPSNTYVVETDTHQIKIGDGKTRYADLEYLDVKVVDSSYETTNNKVSYDYKANLDKADEIIEKGQVVYEIDTGKYKVGDGVTKYSQLPYANESTMTVKDLVGSDPVVEDDEIMVLHNDGTYTARLGDGVTVFSELEDPDLRFTYEDTDYVFACFLDTDGSEVDGSTIVGLPMVDTYENFERVNPVLGEGQIAICATLTRITKLGDGKTKYSALRDNNIILTVDDTDFELDNLTDSFGNDLIQEVASDTIDESNPIITENELLIRVSATRICKVGDGVTKFLDLPKYEPGMVTDKTLVYYDTSENFTENNPILANNTLGIESDTGKYKMGDGINNWLALDYTKNIA